MAAYDFATLPRPRTCGFNSGGPKQFGTQASFFRSKVNSHAITLDSTDVAIVYFGTNDYLTYANSTPAQGVAAIKAQSKVVLDTAQKHADLLADGPRRRAPACGQ